MTTTQQLTQAESRVWDALQTVSDPEIPDISVVELGIIQRVEAHAGSATIDMCPTFAGCPALDYMRDDIRKHVTAAGFDPVNVNIVFDPPWTTDRITDEGRRKLKAFGLAPPTKCGGGPVTEAIIRDVACPFCDSHDTTLESIFGPTLCRAIHYCNACQQSFEQFKPVE